MLISLLHRVLQLTLGSASLDVVLLSDLLDVGFSRWALVKGLSRRLGVGRDVADGRLSSSANRRPGGSSDWRRTVARSSGGASSWRSEEGLRRLDGSLLNAD